MPENKSRRIMGYLILVAASVSFIFYITLVLLAPSHKLEQLKNQHAKNDRASQQAENVMYAFPDYFQKSKEKAFMEARNILAKEDSAYLSLNIPDSLLCLELSAVCLQKAKIEDIAISRIFTAFDRRTLLGILSKPLQVINQEATLAKEPVVIRIAPKDTADAAQSPPLPDTNETKLLFVKLTTYDGFIIYLCESESRHSKSEKKFFRSEKRKLAMRYFVSVFRFKIPVYLPEIRIYCLRRDVLSLYRGLPLDTKIAILH